MGGARRGVHQFREWSRRMMETRLRIDPRIRERRIAVKRDEGRRRLRVLIGAVSTATVIGGALAATHSALLDVDHVKVEGAARTASADIIHAAGLDRHAFM